MNLHIGKKRAALAPPRVEASASVVELALKRAKRANRVLPPVPTFSRGTKLMKLATAAAAVAAAAAAANATATAAASVSRSSSSGADCKLLLSGDEDIGVPEAVYPDWDCGDFRRILDSAMINFQWSSVATLDYLASTKDAVTKTQVMRLPPLAIPMADAEQLERLFWTSSPAGWDMALDHGLCMQPLVLKSVTDTRGGNVGVSYASALANSPHRELFVHRLIRDWTPEILCEYLLTPQISPSSWKSVVGALRDAWNDPMTRPAFGRGCASPRTGMPFSPGETERVLVVLAVMGCVAVDLHTEVNDSKITNDAAAAMVCTFRVLMRMERDPDILKHVVDPARYECRASWMLHVHPILIASWLYPMSLRMHAEVVVDLVRLRRYEEVYRRLSAIDDGPATAASPVVGRVSPSCLSSLFREFKTSSEVTVPTGIDSKAYVTAAGAGHLAALVLRTTCEESGAVLATPGFLRVVSESPDLAKEIALRMVRIVVWKHTFSYKALAVSAFSQIAKSIGTTLLRSHASRLSKASLDVSVTSWMKMWTIRILAPNQLSDSDKHFCRYLISIPYSSGKSQAALGVDDVEGIKCAACNGQSKLNSGRCTALKRAHPTAGDVDDYMLTNAERASLDR